MNGQLFRKKSIEQVSSPEQLNDYIRVSNPGVWLILLSIIILLVGVCVWGVLGHLDTKLSTVAISENGVTTVYVKEADVSLIEEGMKATIGKQECSVTGISSEPLVVDTDFSEYALYIGSFRKGEWVYAVEVNCTVTEGVHNAEIVVDSVSPMSFIVN